MQLKNFRWSEDQIVALSFRKMCELHQTLDNELQRFVTEKKGCTATHLLDLHLVQLYPHSLW